MFNEIDKDGLIIRFEENYKKYGYSPKALDWNKGKQNIRFSVLTSMLQIETGSFLDIGCGFGDLLDYLQNQLSYKLQKSGSGGVQYTGVDIVQEFINKAQKRHSDNSDARFILGDFLDDSFSEEADFIIASGPFNYRFEHTENYHFIESCMNKAFQLAKEAVAFDFLSDKVDYTYNHAWYSNPAVILDMAYKLSRNVILRNDYMPFEFAVIIFKDDSFMSDDTVFTRYKIVRQGMEL